MKKKADMGVALQMGRGPQTAQAKLTQPERLAEPMSCLLPFGLSVLRALQKLSGIMWSRTFRDVPAA